MNPRRLHLLATMNTREMGGYLGLEGKVTPYKTFLRSDDVSMCEAKDLQQLEDYGLKMVIDLRGEQECLALPNVFAKRKGVFYANIAIGPEGDALKQKLGASSFQLHMLYFAILENHDKMKELWKTLASSPKGLVLFHCTAGKDRTGVVAAMLLLLAEVPLLDILADYQISATYIKPIMDRLLVEYPDMPQNLVGSPPEEMEKVCRYLQDNYGGVDGYLKQIGLTDLEILQIRKKIFGINV